MYTNYDELSIQEKYYLSHHGVKGQKWGVRRYQNEDGTLTEAGMKRQAKIDTADQKYRDSQIKKTNRYYDRASISNNGFLFYSGYGSNKLNKKISKYSEQLKKAEQNNDSKKTEKFNQELQKKKNELKTNEFLRRKELKKISELSHEQIQKEKTDIIIRNSRNLLLAANHIYVLPIGKPNQAYLSESRFRTKA